MKCSQNTWQLKLRDLSFTIRSTVSESVDRIVFAHAQRDRQIKKEGERETHTHKTAGCGRPAKDARYSLSLPLSALSRMVR